MSELWRPTGFVLGFEGRELARRRKLHIEGRTPLSGTIHQVRGGKNMLSPILFAACLADSPSVIHNIPNINELTVIQNQLDFRSAKISSSLDDSWMEIYPNSLNRFYLSQEIGEPSRVSIVTAGVLLAKLGRADIPLPGGDDLGERDITAHIEGLQALGAQVDASVPGRLHFSAPEGLKGSNIKLRSPRITTTETLILAATKAKGRTILENTALDPEVEELISFLHQAGANIKRVHDDKGMPTRTIIIDETKQLNGIEYSIPIDRTAVVTYAIAAIATKSREGILVMGAKENELHTFFSLLDEMGGGYAVEKEGIRFFYKGPLQAPKCTIISMNKPYVESETSLGIYADWQPLVSSLFLQAEGTTRLIETAHPDRFHHLRAVQEAGATISFFDPPEEDVLVPYLFDTSLSNSPHGALITGGYPLHPFEAQGGDIRSAAFWAIQGLETAGTSTVQGVHQLERGYHNFIDNLARVGANISVE